MPATVLPTESYSITIRVEIQNKPGMLGKVTTSIGDAGGDIGAVDLSGVGKGTVTRDITVRARGGEARHGREGVDLQGVRRRGCLADLPGHEGHRGDRPDREGPRPLLRLDQPRGHLP